MNPIKNFADLLVAAEKQPEPQRLLFLFAKTHVVPEQTRGEQAGGSIDPVMCVDKIPSEIKNFAELCAEADGVNPNWDFMMVASLPGVRGIVPTSEDADPALQQMVRNLQEGKSLAGYAIFNRLEEVVNISSAP